jgi:hypothetical protein
LAHANRRLAAALVLIGLFMQAIAPYLPMPVMGGRTSWDLAVAALESGDPAWLPSCLSPRDAGGGAPHLGDCPVCLVVQQASTTLAPDALALPMPVAVLRARPALWQQAQRAAPVPQGFSSRAPPLLG